MDAIFSYDRVTQKYGMQFEDAIYYFTYDSQNASIKTVWNESGKLIARSYKGFRNKLGITPGSNRAQRLINTVKQVTNI